MGTARTQSVATKQVEVSITTDLRPTYEAPVAPLRGLGLRATRGCIVWSSDWERNGTGKRLVILNSGEFYLCTKNLEKFCSIHIFLLCVFGKPPAFRI